MFTNQSIKNLAHANVTAGSIFIALSQRQRGRHILNLDLMKGHLYAQGVDVNDADYMATFKSLESLGVGKIIPSKSGGATYFLWTYELSSIAQIGLGSIDIVAKKIATRPYKGVKKSRLKFHPSQMLKPDKKVEETALTIELEPKILDKKYAYIRIPISLLKSLK